MKTEIQSPETALFLFSALKKCIIEELGHVIEREEYPTTEKSSFIIVIKTTSLKYFKIELEEKPNSAEVRIFFYDQSRDSWPEVHSNSTSLQNFQTLFFNTREELQKLEKMLK